MPVARSLLVLGLVAFSGGTVEAEDASACASFAWPVARERVALAAPDLPAMASGSALPSGMGAAGVVLKPAAEATLPVSSERAMKPGTFAGFVTATVPAAGTYQVTVSDDVWVDVSQDGRSTLKPAAHSGKAGCPDVRKSLRFDFEAGPATVEISRAAVPQIKLVLLKAE